MHNLYNSKPSTSKNSHNFNKYKAQNKYLIINKILALCVQHSSLTRSGLLYIHLPILAY